MTTGTLAVVLGFILRLLVPFSIIMVLSNLMGRLAASGEGRLE